MSLNQSDRLSETPPTRVSLLFRLMAIGVIVGGIAIWFGYAGGWFFSRALSPSSIVDTFEQVNGHHPGFRRNHAKGVCFAGYFESNGRGVALSRASVFSPGRVPIIGRFALAGGQPYTADAARTVRSMAILFQLSRGEEWRTGMNNIPVFTVNNAQAFRDLLLASTPVPATKKPDPQKMSAFLANHPESAQAMQLIRGTPVSSGFDNSTYNSLNAFRFLDAKGKAVNVRWSMVPVQTFQPAEAAASSDNNYLFDALIAAIYNHPLQWHLIVTIGQPGDPTNDATIPWPVDRPQIDVGILTIDKIESEETSPARDINFDPLVLPDGIATSDDPLLSARSAAYSQSFTRREGENKELSAISSAKTRQSR